MESYQRENKPRMIKLVTVLLTYPQPSHCGDFLKSISSLIAKAYTFLDDLINFKKDNLINKYKMQFLREKKRTKKNGKSNRHLNLITGCATFGNENYNEVFLLQV